MGKIESVEHEIEQFSAEELAAFRSWFAKFDAVAWDEQFERDVASDKLDKFSMSRIHGLHELIRPASNQSRTERK